MTKLCIKVYITQTA